MTRRISNGGRASRPSSREAAQEYSHGEVAKFRKRSREAAKECSPRRKPWGRIEKQTSPSEAKERCSGESDVLLGGAALPALRSKPNVTTGFSR
jgi:hypothetical protein